MQSLLIPDSPASKPRTKLFLRDLFLLILPADAIPEMPRDNCARPGFDIDLLFFIRELYSVYVPFPEVWSTSATGPICLGPHKIGRFCIFLCFTLAFCCLQISRSPATTRTFYMLCCLLLPFRSRRIA